MNYLTISKQLKTHEGFRSKPYKCTEGRWTIGFGRNLSDKGISKEEANFLLSNDIEDCHVDLNKIYGTIFFRNLPNDIKVVQLDMRFNLGYSGYRGFKKMIQAIKNMDFAEAANQMFLSKWYLQVQNRADELIKMMEV